MLYGYDQCNGKAKVMEGGLASFKEIFISDGWGYLARNVITSSIFFSFLRGKSILPRCFVYLNLEKKISSVLVYKDAVRTEKNKFTLLFNN